MKKYDIDINIQTLYNLIKNTEALPSTYAIVFVYNDENSIDDEEHSSECIPSIERDMIINSFRKSVQYVYSIEGESNFINMICNLQKKHKYIFVYSMAQNVKGIGRRSLIPLLCDYYKLINVSSQFFPSTLSSNKRLMYHLLQSDKNIKIPYTIYVDESTKLDSLLLTLPEGEYIIKPNDESASIGVTRISIFQKHFEPVIEQLKIYQHTYPSFFIQEYIEGKEIEVPLLFYRKNYFCPGCVEIINDSPSGYLDYDTVKMDAYEFVEYTGALSSQLVDLSKKVAAILNFKSICRIDFRICNNIPYIIDIGANPTISYHSSTNYIFRKRFRDESAVYQLLFFIALYNNSLLEPSFDKTK